MIDKLQYGQIRISQPYPGYIRIVAFKGLNVQCTHLLPKPLFKEPDPFLIEILKKEICNAMTNNEKTRSNLLENILSSVKFDDDPIIYNNQEICIPIKDKEDEINENNN